LDLVALSDDLTGALEAGGFFRAAHIDTVVTLEQHGEAAAAVTDLETRRLAPGEAGDRARAAAAQARVRGARYLYMKTDSTLRGPIGAELNAMMRAWPGPPLVYAPAYPRLGRVVRDGRLFVHGQPLEHTDFARDPSQPAGTSCIRRLLEPYCDAPIVPIRRSEELSARLAEKAGAVLYLCDAEIEDDLASLVRVMAQHHALTLTAGTAGMAAELAKVVDVARTVAPARCLARSGLVVNGSLHPASLEQVARAGELSKWNSQGWMVISTDTSPVQDPARRLAQVARRVLSECSIEALVIFGGDTAFEVLTELGVNTIYPAGELLPGVPVSRICVGGRELVLASKAGGFGGPDVIREIRDALR